MKILVITKKKKTMKEMKFKVGDIVKVKSLDWYNSNKTENGSVTVEDMNPYILFKTSKFGNIKVRFLKDEDMNAELLVLDQLFDVE